MMKKLIIILTLALGIQVYSGKSEAALAMIGVGYALDNGRELGMDLAIGGIMEGLSGLVVGGVTAFFNPALGLKVALIGITLDAQGKFPQKNTEHFFSQRYSFINNYEVIKELSTKIQAEYAAGFMIIHFSDNELEKIFASEDLTGDQINLIKQDLM